MALISRLSLNNGRQYFYFIAGAIVGFGLSGIPLFYYNNYTPLAIAVPAVVFVGIIALAALARPGFFAVEITEATLALYTNADDDTEPSLVLPLGELAGWELITSGLGLRRQLVIYRRVAQGTLRSEPFNLFLITGGQLGQLVEVLSTLAPAMRVRQGS